MLLLASICTIGQAQRSYDIQINSSQPSLLIASAGEEPTLSGSDLLLGGSPTGLGGIEPYTYQWLPAENLDNPNISNPIFTGSSTATFTLLITDNRGCLASDTIQIIITGISDKKEQEVLKAYPNPGSGKIRIVAPNNIDLTNTTIQVFDVTGRTVFNESWMDAQQEFLIDVSQLANGQYNITLNDGVVSFSNKIIIQ